MARIPWTMLAVAVVGLPGPVTGQTPLRVVAYNIRHGEGMDHQVDLTSGFFEPYARISRGLLRMLIDIDVRHFDTKVTKEALEHLD